jgi:hypothetical protein
MLFHICTALADGMWLYDPKEHQLEQRLEADIRDQTRMQDFVATAPLNLIYVAHGERMQDISPEERRLYASVDSGFIGQKRLSILRVRGTCHGFRRLGRHQEAGRHDAAWRGPIRHLCAVGGYPKI